VKLIFETGDRFNITNFRPTSLRRLFIQECTNTWSKIRYLQRNSMDLAVYYPWQCFLYINTQIIYCYE